MALPSGERSVSELVLKTAVALAKAKARLLVRLSDGLLVLMKAQRRAVE